MKFFTIILATVVSLAISTVSVAQTSFISIKNMEANQVSPAMVVGSISFNPIGIANGVVKVKMFNEPTGVYILQVKDADGKVAGVKEIQHTVGTTLEMIDFKKSFEGGTYKLEITSPDNTKTSQTIMLLI
jgi:hypothetical protein